MPARSRTDLVDRYPAKLGTSHTFQSIILKSQIQSESSSIVLTHLKEKASTNTFSKLVGVLTRFRQEEIAITCVVEQMFHNFMVSEEHRDYLRFLWFQDGDMNKPIVTYRMNVHLFGAVSSPGCANFGLRKTAQEGEREFGEDIANFLRNDFYVDDGLRSVKTTEDAINLITKSQAMCAKAGLRLHKFASNSV